MRVFLPFEKSGRFRDEFLALGHDAWSCDIEDTRSPGPHIKGNALDYINEGWDLMIACPECRYLCLSGVQHLFIEPGRWSKMYEAADLFLKVWNAPIDMICVENSVMHGYASDIIGISHTQTIQPYNFGEDASKRTALYLKNLPKLENTKYFPPRIITYKGRKVKRWSNQSPCGANKLGPSPDRAERRAETFPGIARAVALQYTNIQQMRLF